MQWIIDGYKSDMQLHVSHLEIELSTELQFHCMEIMFSQRLNIIDDTIIRSLML